MSKLLNSVLDKVSENNNEYRGILRTLNSSIDEKTTALVGDVVTISGYTVDFSSTLTESKEKLVNPISRVIESYVIKDLRSVETVNEQFIEKINDKLENANITSKEEKDSFTNNLNTLLNDKYLEIVKIKRADFINENGTNDDVEQVVTEYIEYLKSAASFDETRLNELFNSYKEDIYVLVSKSLKKISDLYLNNFVSEVSSALKGAIEFDDVSVYNVQNEEEFKPFIPEINPVPEVDMPVAQTTVSEIPNIPEIPVIPKFPATIEEVPSIPEVPYVQPIAEEHVVVPSVEDVKPMDIEPIAPIEIKEEVKEIPKRAYDVEEILKIAKSPIVSMPTPQEKKDDTYLDVKPIVNEKESDTIDSEFNEREIVEEMIRRLTKRLQEIDDRRTKYEEEKQRLHEDKAFVNDLIESASNKKTELDKFEQELNDKEIELSNKQKELDKKINDVMPFANAVLNSEKESL